MWAFGVILAALVVGITAFAGWVFAAPLGLLGIAAIWFVRASRAKHAVKDVDRLREQTDRGAPLDKGGIEFTDKDRETLSS